MRNPELFDVCASIILSDLYGSFPVPTEIRHEKLFHTIHQRFEDPSFEEGFQFLAVIEGTIRWLEQEGYIYISGGLRNGDALGVVLSEKGLRALRSVPSSVDAERKTVGQFLSEAGMSGVTEVASKGIAMLLGIT